MPDVPKAFKTAVRLSLIPMRYFEFIRETEGGYLVVSHCPYGGAESREKLLTYNGDLKPVPTPAQG